MADSGTRVIVQNGCDAADTEISAEHSNAPGTNSSPASSVKDWGTIVDDSEEMYTITDQRHFPSYSANKKCHQNSQDLDSWDPMSDDYESRAFNSYKEPGVTDFVKCFPGNSAFGPSSFVSEQGDVRLYVSNIPFKLTQDGLQNLFSQIGKVVYCKMIPRRDKDMKIAFVGYETVHEAEAAIQKFNGFDLGQGVSLRVKLAITKGKTVFEDMEEKQDFDNVDKTVPVTNGLQNGIEEGESERKSEGTYYKSMSPSIAKESKRLSTGKPCSFCGRLGLKWCSVCKIPYCSRDCQKNDWTQHKLVCPPKKSAESISISTPTTPGDSLLPSPGDPETPCVPDQEQTTSSLAPCEETAQLPVSNQEHTTPSSSETESRNENIHDMVDGFDVNNAEMFAEMCGFDLSQLKVVEKSVTSAMSDKSSSSSIDTGVPHGNPTERPGTPTFVGVEQVYKDSIQRDPRMLRSPVSDPVSKEPIGPTAMKFSSPVNSVSQEPTVTVGCRHFFIKQLTMETPPAGDFFEVVVTQVENPNFFWAQLCTTEALERQEELRDKLQATYCNSVYEHFVPCGNEVCVVQFSFDSLWYRAKVDVINNNGTLKVTYIDFGNYEDVTLDKVRRVKEEFIKFPRQALRLSLHGISSISQFGEWSDEAISFLKSKVLGVKCKAQVSGQHNEILFVKLFDSEDQSQESMINNTLVENGFAQLRDRRVLAQANTDQQSSALMTSAGSFQKGSQASLSLSPPVHQSPPKFRHQMSGAVPADSFEKGYQGPFVSRKDVQKASPDRTSLQGKQGGRGWHSNEGPQDQHSQSAYIQGKQGPENPNPQNSRNEQNYLPSRDTSNAARESMSQASSISGDDEGLQRGNKQKGRPFQVIINAIVNPWEFYAQRTDENLLRQLSMLMQDLNQHMLKSPPSMVSLAPGDKCAAQFSVDNHWYRGVVLERLHSGFRIRYIDFGNSESLPPSAVGPLPQQFQSLPPLSLTCSLAGVSKPKGSEWSTEAVGLFKSSVANKCLMCNIVFTHEKTGTNIVSLVDPSRGGEPTAANALISAGFADPFVPRDTSKYQSGERRVPVVGHQGNHAGTQFTSCSQRTVQGPSGGSSHESFCKPHGAGPRSGVKPGQPLNSTGPHRGERIDIAVFEPAIQSTSFPEDGNLDVVVTEIVSPTLLYIQIGSMEFIQRGAKLTHDMNAHYSAMKYPPFNPQENELCVALFAETGDWCRAFIKEVSPDQSVNVHYVDFGNTEMVPVNCLRPLVEQFEPRTFPFSALRCSLANIKPLDSAEWSDKAMNFVKSSLPLFNRYHAKLMGQQKGILFVDITAENNVSVGQALLDKGLAMQIGAGEHQREDTQTTQWSRPETQRHKLDIGAPDLQPNVQRSHQCADGDIALSKGHPGMHQPGPLECLVFQPAIKSAALPQDNTLLDVMVTEISKSGIFFVQIADHDAALRLTRLSEEMNTFYNSTQMSTYQPQQHQLCAALFSETGDWCRAFVKEITQEGLIEVHYVDYGNTEQIPASLVRPLNDKLAMSPFFSLPCSLENVLLPQTPVWSKQAMDLIKEKVPLFQCLKTKLVSRHPGMLYVDFIISQDPQQSLVQLLVNQGFATRASESGQAVHCSWEHERDKSHLQDGPRPASRQSNASTSSSGPLKTLESCVLEPAIQLVASLESFDAIVTEVASPSSLFIQVLSRANVHSLEQLSSKMNAHYKQATYPLFQAQPNLLCAALFSETGDWCRGFIDNVTPDNCVHVHYLDYGNSEVLPLSKVRPLEKNLLELPPMALRCSLAGISPVGPGGWSDNARQALVSQVPLFSLVHAKVVKKERALLFIDASRTDSQNQETLSQFLIRQGHAKGERQVQGEELGEERYESPCTHISQAGKYGAAQSPPMGSFDDQQASHSTDRVFASAIPLVTVPLDDFFEVLISEVEDPDKIFLQVLNQQNARELAGLSEKLSTHCSCVDNTPYKPILGELCCARFSGDGDWYRALVEQEISDAERAVVFVDYGNRDVVPVEYIRRTLPSFTRLPFQARACHLHGIQPATGSWSHAAANYLKKQLINQCFMVKIIGTVQRDLAVELFEISPGRQPGASINQSMIQQRFAQAQDGLDGAKLQMRFPDSEQFNVVVTDVVHPGEIWAQVMDTDSGNALNSLMNQVNIYCAAAPAPTTLPHPGLECCAQFSIDNTWYRARVLDCPHPGEVLVQYVDFGNKEVTSPERLRTMKDEFFGLPPQAVKLSLANIRPTQQAWSLEAINWLRQIVNRQLRVKVIERLAEYLVVQLDDWEVADGPVNISEQFVVAGFATQS